MKKTNITCILLILCLTLVALSCMTVSAENPVNLFVNPSFEQLDGDQLPVGWTLYKNETDNLSTVLVDKEVFSDGKQSFRFEVPNVGTIVGLYQIVAVKPGKSYEFRISSKSDFAPTFSTMIVAYDKDKKKVNMDWDWIDDVWRPDQLAFYDWDQKGGLILMAGAGDKNGFKDSWLKFTVPEDSGCTELVFHITNWCRPMPCWVDNARLIEL